jgi:dipeptidyl aminopeptidase/acylaminoacyl peptidase
LASGSQDGVVKMWPIADRADPNLLTGAKGLISSMAVFPDGRSLALADTYGSTIRLWDLKSRQEAGVLKASEEAVWSVAVAPDSKTLASATLGRTIQIWDVVTKKEVTKFYHSDGFVELAFSPDGRLLAGGTRFVGDLRVWDVVRKRQVAKLSPGSRVQFTADGTRLAACWGHTVRLWDVATWQIVASFPGHKADVTCLAFAPDGRTLGTGDADGILRLWDVASERELTSQRGHAWTINSVAFAPDGQRLATGGTDGTVKLWELAQLQTVATLTGHTGPVQTVAFSPDGALVASASMDATVRLWPAPPLPTTLPPAEATTLQPAVETTRLLSLQLLASAQATLAREGDAYRVQVTAGFGVDWHAQVFQSFDDLQEGATYVVRFRAKADVPRKLVLAAQIDDPDWHLVGLRKVVSLTQDWREYQYEFQAKNLGTRNRVYIPLGDRKGTVWIADFTLAKVEKPARWPVRVVRTATPGGQEAI